MIIGKTVTPTVNVKIENKNNQKSINKDKMQTTPNKKINPLLMKLKMSKQR